MLIEMETLVMLITFVSILVVIILFIIYRFFVDVIFPLLHFFGDFIYDKIEKKIKAKKRYCKKLMIKDVFLYVFR